MNRLKKLRKLRHLTQKELADKIKVSSQVVSNWERNYSTPDAEDVKLLADALETNVDYILERTDNPEPWQTIDEVIVPVDSEIAEKMKEIGATAIKLTAELLERGMTHEELEKLLQMMIDLKSNKK